MKDPSRIGMYVMLDHRRMVWMDNMGLTFREFIDSVFENAGRVEISSLRLVRANGEVLEVGD